MSIKESKEKQARWPGSFTSRGGLRFRLIFGLFLLAGGFLCWLLVALRH
ncbi:hypothetical protein [Neomoorella glycerini]|nr:hypothetical protein [Moorella glycerini]